MRRKIFALILSVALVITTLPLCAGIAFAASQTIEVSTATAKPGDSVDLTVSIAGNPGITSIDFSLEYDSSQLELTAKQNGSLLGGTINSQTLDKNPYYCGWINSLQKTNCTENGVLITLTFKVKDGATNGKKAISFTESKITAYNADIKKVEFSAKDGYIEVTGGKTDSGKTDSQTGGSGSSSTQGGSSSGTSGGSSSSGSTGGSGTSGGSSAVTPTNPTTPTTPTDKTTDPAGTTDATDKADTASGSDSTQTAGDTQTLTASQKKIVTKVKSMDIKLTSAKYNKSKKTYTLKFKKTNKSYKLDGYMIYKSTKKSSGYSKVAKTTKLTWTDKSIGKKGKTYYYKIRGYRKVAGKTYYTNWSVKKKLTVK